MSEAQQMLADMRALAERMDKINVPTYRLYCPACRKDWPYGDEMCCDWMRKFRDMLVATGQRL